MSQQYHIPVLFHESLDALQIRPDGCYVDLTFGGGGHSRGILKRLGPSGKLVAFDQDADARENLPDDSRITFVPHNFRHLSRFLKLYDLLPVDGVLADLGVSSHQFDVGERGFSTRSNGPLDMRMNQKQELSAVNILAEYPEPRLHKMFEQLGQVTNSKTVARLIVEHRKSSALKTIDDLKTLLQPVVKGNPKKYFAQVFQAIRMEVNDETGALKEMLQQLPDVLKPGGRAAIITFHSGEDRIVKTYFKNAMVEETPENPFSNINIKNELKVITKKPVTPSQEEIKRNPRSGSAKLRVAEKV